MKKVVIVYLVVIMICISGCGKDTKSLTCTKEDEDSKIITDMKFNDDNKLEVFTITRSYPFDEVLSEEEKKEMESYMSIMCTTYDDYEGVDCSIEAQDNSVDLVVSFKLEDVSDDDKAKLGYGDESSTYDQMKETSESSGYTCK